MNALVDACPRCGFTAAACLDRFPYEPPAFSRYIDPEEHLSPKMRRKADRSIRKLERLFPQITFHVCLLSLADGVDAREFGYWLFNRCAPVGVLGEQNRPYSMLLVIDQRSRTAAITIGYGLDSFLDDYVLGKAITDGAALMADGDYGLGISRITSDLLSVLKNSHTRARFAFEKWQRHGSSRHRTEDPLPPPAMPVAGIPEARIKRSTVTLPEKQPAHAPSAR